MADQPKKGFFGRTKSAKNDVASRSGSTSSNTPPQSPATAQRTASGTIAANGSSGIGSSSGSGSGGGGGASGLDLMPTWSFSALRPRKNEQVDVIFVNNGAVCKIHCHTTMSPAEIKISVQNELTGRRATVARDPMSMMARLGQAGLSNAEKAELLTAMAASGQMPGGAGGSSTRVQPEQQLVAPPGAPDLSDFFFKIKDIEYYFLNESLPLQRNQFIQICSKAHVVPILELAPRDWAHEPDEELKEDIKRQAVRTGEITTLIGPQLSLFLSVENEEIDDFRRYYSRLCMTWKDEIQNNRDMMMSIQFPQYLRTEPAPPKVPEKLTVSVHFNLNASVVTKLAVSPKDSVDSIKADAFKKIAAIDLQNTQSRNPDDFWLKVTGLQEYMFGEVPFIEYDYVRKSISKGKELHITMVAREPLDETPDPPGFLDHMLASQEDPEWLEPCTYAAVPQSEHPYSIFTMAFPFEVRLVGLDNLFVEMSSSGNSSDMYTYVMAEIIHSGERISHVAYTSLLKICTSPRWNQTLVFDNLQICNIPKGSRILFTAMKRTQKLAADQSKVIELEATDVPLGWVGAQLLDSRDTLRSGPDCFKLWMNERANPIGTCVENLGMPTAPILQVEFKVFPRPVVFPRELPEIPDITGPPPTRNVEKQLMEIVTRDPLAEYTLEQKKLVWEFRHHLVNVPAALPKFLLSVPKTNFVDVLEAHRLLLQWRAPQPIALLELLDAKFADPLVREYAVSQLDRLADGELQDVLLQLTQVIKYEAHHDSALARFLLRRSLYAPQRLGQALYWHLRAEMHLPWIAERYGLLLEALLWGVDLVTRKQWHKGLLAQNLLCQAAVRLKKIKETDHPDPRGWLQSDLAKQPFDPRFQIPLDPRLLASGLKTEKCKFMTSKKLPLFLFFQNAEPIGEPLAVIFKHGDDLRQDVLTLQMIRLMDKLWKKEGWDLRLQPYGCVATGDEIGLIEVVLASATVANINTEAGGAKKVFSKTTLVNWLKNKNPSPADWALAQENFLFSCAGYCVATFVLGIGDRHSDNIMLTQRGHLFHIDFGHFLGNVKYKMGIKRERAPFVFTKQFAEVLDGKQSNMYKHFINVCCQAYNVIRKNSHLFINLFMMMLSTGIPELKSESDITYLREALYLEFSEIEAARHFTGLIEEAYNCKSKTFDDAIHVIVHSRK